MTEPKPGHGPRDARPGARAPLSVEVLYLDGCPGYRELLPRVRAFLGHRAEVRLRKIEAPERAHDARFLGSPTLRVNGRDVEPGAAERTDYGLKCRLYRTQEGTRQAPPDEWIRRALEGGG